MTRPIRPPLLYSPRDGLPAKLLKFFLRNPDEELTFADIEAKWGHKAANVSMAVKRLVDAGLVDYTPRTVRKRSKPDVGFWS